MLAAAGTLHIHLFLWVPGPSSHRLAGASANASLVEPQLMEHFVPYEMDELVQQFLEPWRSEEEAVTRCSLERHTFQWKQSWCLRALRDERNILEVERRKTRETA